MKQILSAVAFATVMIATAQAAPVTVGSVSFDSDGAATDVLWAQGGVFSGLPADRRGACVDNPITRTSSVGSTQGQFLGGGVPITSGITCRADEIAGWDPANLRDDAIELDENNTQTQQPDVLAAFFAKPLINGAGNDLIIFETLNQNDSPGITLILNGMQIMGHKLSGAGGADVNGDIFTIWGFDFSDAPLSIAMGAVIGEPIYIQTFRDAQNTPVGSSDIAAIIGLNFGDVPPPAVPLPAALPLFFAGLAGLGFAGRRRRKA